MILINKIFIRWIDRIRCRGQSNLEGGFNNIRKEKRTNNTGGMELSNVF